MGNWKEGKVDRLDRVNWEIKAYNWEREKDRKYEWKTRLLSKESEKESKEARETGKKEEIMEEEVGLKWHLETIKR